MKMLIFSDIHANREALDAVLKHPGISHFLCLGDITGYGPDPEYCVQQIQGLENLMVISGNHDAAATGRLDIGWFNQRAKKSVLRTRELLSVRSFEWLSLLPDTVNPEPHVLTVHGSPAAPLTEYLWGGDETYRAFMLMQRSGISVCFAGHTHETVVFSCTKDTFSPDVGYPLSGEHIETYLSDVQTICNPGSVGFPRAFNAMKFPCGVPEKDKITDTSYPAFYAVWDTDSGRVLFCEARYNRHIMLDKMHDAGFS